MEGSYSGLIVGGKEYPIGEVGGNRGEGVGLEGLSNAAGARGGCGDGVRWMRWYECAGKELGAEEGEVVLDGEGLGFCVKMANG